MGTFMAKKEEADRNWIIVDVKDQVLGRAATQIANILRGKHRPTYTPHVDNGDFVVVINAAHVKLTGKKWQDKLYHHHTGYIGNLKSQSLGSMLEEHPDRVLINAVKGMLPKNKLGAAMLKKLKVYPGAEHRHAAQQPQPLEI